MKFLLLVSLLVLASCAKEGTPVAPEGTNNQDFGFVRLFSIDSCTIYRFNDGGYRYFTNCQGTVSHEHHNPSSRTTELREIRTEIK